MIPPVRALYSTWVVCAGAVAEVHAALAAAKAAALAARAPFQWVDGALVTAMRQGDIILIDELNLAEDAVLERMNRCTAILLLLLQADAED